MDARVEDDQARVYVPQGDVEPSVPIRSRNTAMDSVERIAAEIAATDVPVLLSGESGTGKEVLARWIHRMSTHSKGPFRKIVCARLRADGLLDQLQSTLAPTNGQRDGQDQDGIGSLYLDEIGELDPACQRALLYHLPDGEDPAATDSLKMRLISSTAQEDEPIGQGHLLRQLYYRLGGICLRLVPLRQRKEDIPVLVDYFLKRHASMLRRARPALSSGTMDLLMKHSWPGNIRELESVVRKFVALGEDSPALLDPSLAAPAPGHAERSAPSLKEAARAASYRAERELIMQTLERTHWNRKRAAQELRISYKSLLYKLKQIDTNDSSVEKRG